MAQKSGAVKALTGGIAHLFKQNKVGFSLNFHTLNANESCTVTEKCFF